MTRTGDTFAGRMGASLLHAIGLPELITTSPRHYEALAVLLARDQAKLGRIKQKLADNRLVTPLFDTARFTRHLEAAYIAMHERHGAGSAPEHIFIGNS